MTKPKKKLLSGIQPSGKQHIGNYFGAMKQFVEYQEEYDSHIMIADLHALTTVHDREKLQTLIFDTAVDLLAVGLDPKKLVFFRQSDVPEHTELTWIFNTLITVPFLERATSYKDKIAKGLEPTVGLFDYPVLQATDILMYDPDVVPVGEDQRQHIEYSRDIALKFNNTFGETFKLPKPLIREEVAVVPGTDGQKMSKSYGNTIPLFATDEEIEKAVMSIPTDSQPIDAKKDPDKDHVFALHKLFAGEKLEEIRTGYAEGGLGYGDSKKMLIEEIKVFVTPMREKREAIARDRESVLQILENGGERARSIAKAKMHEVREKIGLVI